MRVLTPFLLCRAGGLLLAGLASLPGRAQAPTPPDSLATLARRLAQYQRQAPVEQLYLHLDRPAYVAGETLWFKVYAVDGTRHRPLPMSKVAYVEVLDVSQRPVLQAKVALVAAMGQGALALPAELATGQYVVRAYTNWMKNAGPEFYFQCPVRVVNPSRPAAAITPAPAANPAYDIRFFAEGGQLVRGLPGRVAFEVTDQQGRGVAASGTVADARDARVATFETLKFGLGSFLLTPAAAGAAYVATVRLPGGATLSRPLPAVAERGYALLVTEASPTQLLVAVQGPPLVTAPLRLLGHSGAQVTVAAEARPVGGRAIFTVDQRQLRPGITHFTVLSGQQPVAERLYFRRPTHPLLIEGRAAAAAYGPRRRVQLQVGAAQAAALSLAVYQLDSLAGGVPPADISSYLLLAADLKGFIEDAGYYFRDSSATARQAADNLMLTQGWRRFRWEDVAAGQPANFLYPPELSGYLLQGRVSQAATGLPAAGIATYLSLPGRSFRFGNSVSHADGLVQFELPDFYGLRKLVLQTNPDRDSTYRLALLSPFTPGGGWVPPGAPGMSARIAIALIARYLQVQTLRAYGSPPPRYRPVPGDTVAFYGLADERYLLDDYVRFPTLEDVMREYVPGVLVRRRKDGFHFIVVDRPRHINLRDNSLTLLDGLPIFNLNQLMAFDPLKIKKLDVIANRYFLGQQVYDGVVSYATYRGDLGGFPLNPRALIEEYEGPQVPRELYAPRYDTPAQQQSRLPDLRNLRNLLYWNPDVRLAGAGQPQTLDFYTSDQAGRYLVVVQGLGADGHLGSLSFPLEVKPAL